MFRVIIFKIAEKSAGIEIFSPEKHKDRVKKFLGWVLPDNKIVLVVGWQQRHEFLLEDLSRKIQSSDIVPEEIKEIIDSDKLNTPDIAGDCFSGPSNYIDSWRSTRLHIVTGKELRTFISQALGMKDLAFGDR